MNIYQALQLNAAGSKKLIKNAQNTSQKIKWSLVYFFKILLTITFCFLFVTVYSLIFGKDNSIAGVVVLLILLTVRQANFGISTKHSAIALSFIFLILIVGPKLYNAINFFPGFFVNIICILAITILSCHNVVMSNHFIFVLSYLLLLGYNVNGHSYYLRIYALIAGALICTSIYVYKHKNQYFKRNFIQLIKEFNINSTRTQWQIKLALGISLVMFLASLVHIPRIMWIGICTMSLLSPFSSDVYSRAKIRAPFNIVGSFVFMLIYFILPKNLHPFIGILGGIGVGFSTKYSWQNIFNSLGALAVATSIYGLFGAVILRISANILGTIYCLIFDKIYHIFLNYTHNSITINQASD